MRNILLLSWIIFFLYGCENSEVQTYTYDVVFRGSSAGFYIKRMLSDKQFDYSYQYTDRGRGPEITESIVLNELGMIASQEISGVNYLKVSIDEYFRQENAAASWKNSFEENKSDFDGASLYFRYDGSPAIYEILSNALLKDEDEKISLFPHGEVSLLDRKPFMLSDDLEVTLLMISGLGMNPSYVWMKQDEMIARIDGNRHIIRVDMLPYRMQLKEWQDKEEDDFLKKLASELSIPLGEVLVQNVNVLSKKGQLIANQDVSISGNTITGVYPTGTSATSFEKVMDGTGKTLMPGMFDMHTHNSKFRGLLHVAGGITSVRDLANNKQLKVLSAQFDKNEIIGPRIVTFCGIIDGSGPYANKRNVVETLEEGLQEIHEYKKLGYQQIKLYSSIRPEWVLPMTEKAHELGMRVSGHIPAYMTASQAIDQGYDEIQHINMLFLNFLPDTIDTRTPLRFTMPATYGRALDLRSDDYLNFLRQLQKEDILVDLTISIFENMLVAERGELSPTYSPIAHRMPLMTQRGFYSGGLPKTEDQVIIFKESFNKMLEVIAHLYENGVDVVPGTDGLPGFLYHRELELYVKAGIPAIDVLKMATIQSAEITGKADLLGSIEAGKLADLILVDGNPLEDISNIRRIEWTMKGGYLYYAKDLYEAQGIQHFE